MSSGAAILVLLLLDFLLLYPLAQRGGSGQASGTNGAGKRAFLGWPGEYPFDNGDYEILPFRGVYKTEQFWGFWLCHLIAFMGFYWEILRVSMRAVAAAGKLDLRATRWDCDFAQSVLRGWSTLNSVKHLL
jgi:hypothetical protein